jgi:hypothetical protein
MTFTYSGNPSSTQRDAIRFLLNDTDATDVLLTDEEIEYLIAQWSDTYESARAGAEIIASKFSRDADNISKTVGDLSISKSFNNKAAQYRELAKSFLDQRMRKTPPIPTINPQSIESTANRDPFTPTTDFSVGQFDNPGSNTDVSIVTAE